MNFRWFISKTIRQATEMRRQVQKLLNHQRDLLSTPAVTGLEQAMASIENALANGANRDSLAKEMTALEQAANKWLKPYPNASIRENIEVFLVAIAVAVGIRTFFLQPFKIPTGSMQPTLFGVMPPPVPEGPGNDSDLVIPNQIERFLTFWFRGTSYYHETAKASGRIEAIKPPIKFLLFNLKQEYQLGGVWHTIWFPDDMIFERAGLVTRGGGGLTTRQFNAGDDVIRIKVMSGDHLFVDRLTYNFRKPTRGEIIVFATAKIFQLPQDQFYIKRLVGLGGERISIGNDQHVRVNGTALDASTPRFENVYTFNPARPPVHGADGYYGHVNGANSVRSGLAPNFSNETTEYQVPIDGYLAFGDNTLNSSDSRTWGPLPQENVIGKSLFVYWPISSRFGWGHR